MDVTGAARAPRDGRTVIPGVPPHEDPAAASLYVHIPFCERKCPYCDFYSVPGTEGMADFLWALGREIALAADRHGPKRCDTVYIGGGTPSLLTPQQLEGILARLRRAFRIAPHAEITLEANPGTVTRETLAAFRALGVNRLSLGVQSFGDRELALLGRIHDGAEAVRCVEWCRAAAFESIGLDLMYAIPGQTEVAWNESLCAAIALAPEHIAAYGLTVAEGTPLAHLVRAREVRTHPAGREAGMYERTMAILAAHGYEHYEVSNYALPGHRCRHNCAYWTHRDYLAFGPSAHSFRMAGEDGHARRWWNVADLPTYVDLLARGRLPVAGRESVDRAALLYERILLSLRCGSVDLAALRSDFGYDMKARQGDLVRWLMEAGLATQRGAVLRLTERGYLLCDEISGRLCRDVSRRAPRLGEVQPSPR